MTTPQWERFHDALSDALARQDVLPANAAQAYQADLRIAADSRLQAARAGGQYTLTPSSNPLGVLAEVGSELVAARGPFTEAVRLEEAVETVVLQEIAHELADEQLSGLARLYPAEIADRAPRYLLDGEETGSDLWERNLREILEERILLAAATVAVAREAR